MLERDNSTVSHLTKALAFGAVIGLAFVTAVMWFDFIAIGSMIESSRGGAVLASVFIVGSLVKGAVFAAALAIADLDRRDRRTAAIGASPATAGA